MALFQGSTKTWQEGVQEVADSGGASASTEMLNRAHQSLRAGFQFLNSRASWEYLLTHADPTTLVAPINLTGVSATGGVASASFPTDHGLAISDYIVGSGFPRGTLITATGTNNCGFNATLTGIDITGEVVSATATRAQYDAPSDFKKPYHARLLGAQRPLTFVRQRLLGRLSTTINKSGSVYNYTISNIAGAPGNRASGSGKLTLIDAPNSADVLDLWYYRRMYIGTASADGNAIDIPEDFEYVPLAFAKWHYLTDKNVGNQSTTWFSLSERGIELMLRDNVLQPDENLAFLPGAGAGFPSDNSTIGI